MENYYSNFAEVNALREVIKLKARITKLETIREAAEKIDTCGASVVNLDKLGKALAAAQQEPTP